MIEIRRAGPDDAEAIARVHVRAHGETYPPLLAPQPYAAPDLALRSAQWRGALGGPGAAFVASDGGRVVGFGHLHDDTITTLYILASHHRRGIGRRLLARLLSELSTRGVAEARFDVLARNAGAIAFYEAEGARPIGRRTVEEADGTFEDIVYAIATDRRPA